MKKREEKGPVQYLPDDNVGKSAGRQVPQALALQPGGKIIGIRRESSDKEE